MRLADALSQNGRAWLKFDGEQRAAVLNKVAKASFYVPNFSGK
jgi:hypothetical protein